MPLRRRRPLLRAAAVGGGAYYMGKRHAESEEQAPAQGSQAAPPASSAQGSQAAQPSSVPPAQGGVSADAVQRLRELAELHDQGVLTEEEFAAQKALILG